jgi:23S rRNA (cytosine1962-C5)-methyltransferase
MPAPTPQRALATARLILGRHQDRRVRGGHPWIFSNEIAGIEGGPNPGNILEVADERGAFLGKAYWNPHSLIAARVLTRGRDEIDVAFFIKRLERAVRFRERVLPGEQAVRVVYGESDQLPGLVVDRYGDVLVAQVLTLGIECRQDLVREALEKVMKPRGVIRAADSPLRALEGLELERGLWWGEVPERLETVVEGFRLEVDPWHGQKTGLFLDQRLNRRLAEAHARDKRVLDLFCYQGEWALHALRGGAAGVLAVDSSQPALDAAARNLERNGLAGRVELRRGDAFDAARDLERAGEKFGVVIVDPPALIKSRKHLAAGAKAYREVNRAAMAMLEEDGVLITCSCSHHLEDALFKQVLIESARAAHRPMRVLGWSGEGPDHPQLLAVPETHYLKCAVLQAV